MKETKKEKGITLIALIITIVVLLILAVVAINSITNDGILSYAENSATIYNNSVNEEKDVLSDYTYWLTYGEKKMSQNGLVIEQYHSDDTTTTISVGTKVTNYTAEGKEWRVLGVKNDRLLLVATTNIGEQLSARADLDSNCAKYAQGDFAESARSITLEDVNRIEKYNPNESKYGEGTIGEYGSSVTVTLTPGGVSYRNNVTGQTGSWGSNWYDKNGQKMTVSGLETTGITNGYYSYEPTFSGDAKSMLFENAGYWLADSEFDVAGNDEAWHGFFWINEGEVSGRWCFSHRYGPEDTKQADVRPVVVLKWNVRVNTSGELYIEG